MEITYDKNNLDEYTIRNIFSEEDLKDSKNLIQVACNFFTNYFGFANVSVYYFGDFRFQLKSENYTIEKIVEILTNNEWDNYFPYEKIIIVEN